MVIIKFKYHRTNRRIKRAGSLCTGIMGAGGGGFIICWAPKHKHIEIKNKLNIKTWVNVKFSSSGSQIIFRIMVYKKMIQNLIKILEITISNEKISSR